MLRLLLPTGCAIALAAAPAPARAQNAFIADLRGASENPPAASPASGFALVLFDPAFETMTVRATFSGLTTPTTDSHIHCCAPRTANAIVAVGFRPAGFPIGVTGGEFNASFDLTSAATFNAPFVAANGGTPASARTALINGTLNELAYVNIHTSRFPGGEIRGQLVASSELGPQAYSLLPEVALQTAEFQDSTIRGYLHDLRSGRGGDDGRTATLGEGGRVGMFLTAAARFGEFEGRANRPAVDLGATGVMGGLDVRLGPGTLVGVMAGLDSSDARLSPTSRESQVESWFGGLYGSLALGPAFVDLQASFGRSDHELFRRITVGAFDAESAAEAEGEYWMLAGTAGLSLGRPGLEIEPYLGARYVDFELDGFAETGNMAALTIGAAELESLQSIAGLRIGAEIPMGGASLRPSVRGEWRHEFSNDEARPIAGSFGGAGPFSFAAAPLGDDHLVVGAGFTVAGRGALSFALDYSGQLGGGYDVHAVSAGLRLRF
jgi:outer membrane autotransporter protein